MRIAGLFFTIVIVSFFSSCTNETSSLKHYGDGFSKIMLSDSGLVRGININDPYEKVKSIDTKNLKEAGDDDGIEFLFYEFSMGDSGEYYTIAYYFADKKVNSIEMDIYTNTESKAGELFSSFQSYFNDKYGASLKEGEYLIWTDSKNKHNNKQTRIVAADESPAYRKGKLTFIFQDAEL